MVEFCWFIYAVGVFGAIIGTLEISTTSSVVNMRAWGILALLCFIPGLNYVLMWESLNEAYIRLHTIALKLIIKQKCRKLTTGKVYSNG